MALSSFIMGQFDPLEILGLLSEEVLFNFSLPSVLENTALFYYHSVRLYFCSRQSWSKFFALMLLLFRSDRESVATKISKSGTFTVL